MSLDEAIRYYSRLADECRRKVNIERYDYMDLKDLAAEHGQLADWLNELKVLREKIQTLLKKDRWIPITEKLPEPYKTVIVTDVETIDTYTCEYHGGGYWNTDTGDAKNRIIAWMPLPEPYKEDKA